MVIYGVLEFGGVSASFLLISRFSHDMKNINIPLKTGRHRYEGRLGPNQGISSTLNDYGPNKIVDSVPCLFLLW